LNKWWANTEENQFFNWYTKPKSHKLMFRNVPKYFETYQYFLTWGSHLRKVKECNYGIGDFLISNRVLKIKYKCVFCEHFLCLDFNCVKRTHLKFIKAKQQTLKMKNGGTKNQTSNKRIILGNFFRKTFSIN
jgi:hypothetical protein